MQTKFLTFVLNLIYPLALLLPAGFQSEPSASLAAGQTEWTVGDVIPLVLSVRHDPALQLEAPVLEPEWGDFEIRSTGAVERSENEDGSITSTQSRFVILWAPGDYVTPPLTLNLVDPQGVRVQVDVQPASLSVLSVLQEGDTELRDIKPQASLPFPSIWPGLAIALLGLAALTLAGVWLYRRRKSGQLTAGQAPDLRPAYQVALDELERIENLKLPAQGRFKEHYTLTTYALRRYLEKDFQAPAMDRTTYEIRTALRKTRLSGEQQVELVTILGEADLVKFAKVIPAESRAKDFIESARGWVLSVRARPDVGEQIVSLHSEPAN